MLIRLFYALSDGPMVHVTDVWPTAWDALDFANNLGAVVAGATILDRNPGAA